MSIENRKLELERQFLELTKNKQNEVEELRGLEGGQHRKFQMEKDLWEGEKIDLLRKMKELNRKIEDLQDDVRLVEAQNSEIKSDRKRLQMENDNVVAANRALLN